MAYLPENHKKYPLLMRSRDRDWEVFSYPSFRKLEEIGESGLEPYGYKSLDDYLTYIDKRKSIGPEAAKNYYDELKKQMHDMNNKEDWSVCLYIGESEGKYPVFVSGRAYYWPCSKDNPIYTGIIDEEEWTPYLYPTSSNDWEILEDPTGMAYRTIYEGIDGVTKEQYNHVIEQAKKAKK